MADEGLPSPRRSAAGTIMAETVRELREAQRWAAARQATLARSPPTVTLREAAAFGRGLAGPN